MTPRVGAILERGMLRGPASSALARVWASASARRIARPLALPDDVFTVGVGGATLGGSYRTPVAIALAKRFQETNPGAVALIGHGYGAKLGAARRIGATDDVREVGDEALVCARANVRTFVGPNRQRAVDAAVAAGARVLVFDSLLDARPRRLDWRVLSLDALAPWGSGHVPPRGDLRAPPEALLAHADLVLEIGGSDAPVRLMGLRALGGDVLPLCALRGVRFGLSTSIARPSRVRAALAAEGLEPTVVVEAGDHKRPRFPRSDVDAWVVTEKCAAWLPTDVSHLLRQSGAPVFALQMTVEFRTTELPTTRAITRP